MLGQSSEKLRLHVDVSDVHVADESVERKRVQGVARVPLAFFGGVVDDERVFGGPEGVVFPDFGEGFGVDRGVVLAGDVALVLGPDEEKREGNLRRGGE